jgi:ABC-type dipeptide/oligopeptide/nickel transport system permease component
VRLLFTAWLAVTLSFIALRVIPGDAVETQLRITATPEENIAARRAALGLDKPLPVQYLRYTADLLRGDLGQSLTTREAVTDMIWVRLAPTFSLALLTLLTAIALGLLLGTLPVLRQLMENDTLLFRAAGIAGFFSTALTTLALAAPVYWTATLAIYLISNQLSLLPSGGADGIKSLILPAMILGFHVSGAIARVVEASLRESLSQPFVQTARAKGLPVELVFEHALRVGLLPVFTITALQAGFLLGGTVIIEMIFTRRGLGSLMIQAVQEQDYPVVQGLVLFSALVYAVTRGLADFLRHLADPRLRLRSD